LAEAVNDLLRSPEKLERMGRESRKRVEQEFSWESVARQTIRFYTELTSSRRDSDSGHLNVKSVP